MDDDRLAERLDRVRARVAEQRQRQRLRAASLRRRERAAAASAVVDRSHARLLRAQGHTGAEPPLPTHPPRWARPGEVTRDRTRAGTATALARAPRPLLVSLPG